MGVNNRLEMFLALNTEAFKKGLGDVGTGMRVMAGNAGAAFTETKARLQENLVAVRNYNSELSNQGSILQTLRGQVTALVGAYLGFQSIAGLAGMMKDADTAAFGLEASLRAANREFQNIGSVDTWTAAIGRLSGELKIYSKSELKTAVASTVDMTKRLGFTSEQMEILIKRTADLSAGKTDLNGGIERVTSAMRGEAEASEYLGLTLNENYVKAWHEAHNAHGQAWKDLSDLEKAQVRFNVFLEQASPLAGKAAASVSTMAGAYALAKANIHDAVSENQNAVEATKQLAKIVSDHAGELGELATVLINVAAKTIEFVLENKEAVIAVGLLAAGAGTLSFAISTLTTIWQAMNVVMLATTGMQLVPWLGSVGTAIKGVDLAALTLKTTLGALSGLVLAFTAGWEIGKWLSQFDAIDPIKRAFAALIYTLDRAQLGAQKFWAWLTGGDVGAVEKKIAIAKQAYAELIAEIDKPEAEKNKKQPEKPKEKAEEKPAEKPVDDKASRPSTYEELKAHEEAAKNKDKTPDELKALAAENKKEAKDRPITREQEAMDTWSADQLTDEQRKERQDRLGSLDSTDEIAKKKADEAKKKAADEKEKNKQQDAARPKDPIATPPSENEEVILSRFAKDRLGIKDKPAEEEPAQPEDSNADEKKAKKEQEEGERRQRDQEQAASKSRFMERQKREDDERAETAKKAEAEIAEANARRTEEAKKGAEEWAQAEAKAAEKAKSVFQQYFDKVKSLTADLANRQKSVQQELEGLDTTTPKETIWRRHAKEAKEYEKAAQAALKAGNLNEALSLSDQARSAYSSLKGGAGDIGEEQAAAYARKGVKSSGFMGIDIAKMLQQTTAKSAVASMPAGDLFGGLTANVKGQLAAVASGGTGKTNEQVGGSQPGKIHELRFQGGKMQGAESDIDALLRQLEQAGLQIS